MKSFVVLFFVLSALYQNNCSPSGVEDLALSEGDNDYISYAASQLAMNKRPRLWNIEEDIAQVYAVEDFWNNIFDGDLMAAETLNLSKGLKFSTIESSTIENIFALFYNRHIPITTLDYLYQSYPQMINYPYYHNIFMTSRQEVLNYFYENYSNDYILMERLLEAVCLNSRLTLPDEFFAVESPEIARRRIEIVNAKAPHSSDLLRKCYELPRCSLGIKPVRSNTNKIVRVKNSQRNRRPLKAKSGMNTYLKGKLERKLGGKN